MRSKYYLQLIRPANIITAIADILAGIAISTFVASTVSVEAIVWLCISTVGLYGGGIVFNDIFDLSLDRIERPERVLPSAKISLNSAVIFGTVLLLMGVGAAWAYSTVSGLIALAVAVLALIYDKFGKHHAVLGPLNMGFCRGGNLLLGMSAAPEVLSQWAWLGIIPIVYIAAITMISRDEVHGGQKTTLYLAAVLYLLVHVTQLYVSFLRGNVLLTLPLILLHAFLVFRPLWQAIQQPGGARIGKAVKAGVLSLIVMDAAWLCVAGHFEWALLVLCLLPVSLLLAKAFAVT